MIHALPILLLFVSTTPSYHAVLKNGPATLELSCDNQRDHLALADVLTVSLSIEESQAIHVEAWNPLPKASSWTIVDRSPVRTAVTSTGTHRWQQTLRLAANQPGEAVPLELLAPRWKLGEGEWRTVLWPGRTIQVTTRIRDPDVKSMRDATGIEDLPPQTASTSWQWFWLLVLPMALVLLWWKQRRAPERARDSYREALRAVDRLTLRRLPEKGRAERFVTLLTVILREYLERRCEIPARRLTSAELVDVVSRSPAIAGHAAPLRTFFERCDLVKYSRTDASPAECAALAVEARNRITALEASMTDPSSVAQNS